MQLVRRLVALTWSPALASLLLAWGCANGSGGDLTPSVDPTLPEVDASRDDPAPSEKLKDPSDDPPQSDDDAGAPPAKDAGKDSGKDSGPKDSGSTPPPNNNAPKPSVGEVLISEVMYDTTTPEPLSEWIEVYNTTSSTRTLSGLTIVDGGGRTHTIGSGVTIAPGAYVLLARSSSGAVLAGVPSSAIVYEYGAGLADNAGIQLANGTSGAVFLKNGSTTVAQADYGGWFSGAGQSIQLFGLSFSESASKANWCQSQNAWAVGSDLGTPGAANDCP